MEQQSDANGSVVKPPEFPPLPSLHPKPAEEQSGEVRVRPIHWYNPAGREPAPETAALSLPPPPVAANSDSQPLRGSKPSQGVSDKEKMRSRRSRRTASGQQVSVRPVSGRESKVLAWLAALLLCGGLFFFLGLAVGLYRPSPIDERELSQRQDFKAADAQEEKLLSRAFSLLRDGEGTAALRTLQELRTINPQLTALSYTAALAALQTGDIATAMEETDSSLVKGERVSDSYAVAAAVESLKPGSVEWQAIGDTEERGEFFLRQAIAADQANPAPRLELGIRLRGKGKNAEAVEMLESARLRLHPVDQGTVIDTTLLLIALEQTATEGLPDDLDPDKSNASLMGAAYVALRQGEVASGAALLEKAKSRLPSELYFYLLGDPAFGPYRQSPALAPLFQ